MFNKLQDMLVVCFNCSSSSRSLLRVLFVVISIVQRINAAGSTADLVRETNALLERNEVLKCVQLFEQAFRNNKEDRKLQYEYFKFLQKVGDFQKILSLQAELSLSSGDVEEVKRALEVVERKSHEEIVKDLQSKSSYSPEVMCSSVIVLMRKRIFIQAKNKLEKLIKCYGEVGSGKREYVCGFAGRAYLYMKEYDKAKEHFRLGNLQVVADKVDGFEQRVKQAKSHPPPSQVGYLKGVYTRLKPMIITDQKYYYQADLNLYSMLMIQVLEMIVTTCIDNRLSVGSQYSVVLVEMAPDDIEFVKKHLNCLLIEEKLSPAESFLIQAKNKVPFPLYRSLQSSVKNKKDEVARRLAEEEKQKEEEDERKKEEKIKRIRQNKTEHEGSDFLGYYRTLGVKKSDDLNAIKKGKRMMVKKSKKMKFKGPEEKEQHLIKINHAYEALSDPLKKEMYDCGLDPTNDQHLQILKDSPYFYGGGGGGARNSGGNTYFYSSNGGNAAGGFGDEFEDIFKRFFGGGGRGGATFSRRVVFM